MMRQNEARRRTPVLVLLDVRPGAHDRASFERAVEACASIVTAIDRTDRPVEVMLSTGQMIGTPGRRHLGTVMDELAVVEPHGPDRIVAPRLAGAAPARSSRSSAGRSRTTPPRSACSSATAASSPSSRACPSRAAVAALAPRRAGR